MDHVEVTYEPVVLPFTFIGCYNIRGFNILHILGSYPKW